MPARIETKCLQAIYEWGISHANLLSELARPREGRAVEVAVDMHFDNVAKALSELVSRCPVSRGPGKGRAPDQVIDFDTEIITGWLGDIRENYLDRTTEQTIENLDELAYEIKHNYLAGVGGEEWNIYGWRRPRRVAEVRSR